MLEEKNREILLSYQYKRDKAKRDLEKRIEEVHFKIPKIKKIEEEISKQGLYLTKAILLSPSEKEKIVSKCKIDMENLRKEKEFLLKKYKVPENYLEIRYECPICKDTGFLGTGQKCNCYKQQIINEAYKMSNISRMIEKQNFHTLDMNLFSDEVEEGQSISTYKNMLSIISLCEKFIKEFDIDNRANLLFYGDTGLGKTFMCNCVAKELLDRGYVVIYQTAFKMFEVIEDYKFKNPDGSISKTNYENIFECDLLIIDDLGAEFTNSFTTTELFNIINTRFLGGKKTIISTNLTPAQLGDNYAQRIFSRIFDGFQMVKFIGKDLRWENKKDALSR